MYIYHQACKQGYEYAWHHVDPCQADKAVACNESRVQATSSLLTVHQDHLAHRAVMIRQRLCSASSTTSMDALPQLEAYLQLRAICPNTDMHCWGTCLRQNAHQRTAPDAHLVAKSAGWWGMMGKAHAESCDHFLGWTQQGRKQAHPLLCRQKRLGNQKCSVPVEGRCHQMILRVHADAVQRGI